MKRYSWYNKSMLQQVVWQYCQRRKEYRKEGRKELADEITKKIENRRASIRRIEKKEEFMKNVAKIVENVTDVNVWRTANSKKGFIAKGMFSKYCLDNKINQANVSWYLGCKHKTHPAILRRRFQKSLTNPVNLQLWNKFKLFINEREQC
jgi:hypothetical protein